MKAFNNVLDMIGNTRLLELTKLDTGPCQLFAKLEFDNPGGSIKDRIAISMITTAEKEGKLKPGDTIIEATAGNTGLGLALVASQKGYPLTLVMPDKMSTEKVANLRALGAEVMLTRSDVAKGHPEYYQDVAKRIAESNDKMFYINQFSNPANVRAHEEGTAPEIWEQMDHKVDAVVCGVGSGGTITGIGRFMKGVNPDVEVILADPEGSILAEYIETGNLSEAGRWLVEGIGEDFIPGICDLSLVSKGYTVSDKDAFNIARELLKKEGIMAGSSSGTLLTAALKYCREQTTPKRVVTLFPDSGNKYLSKMYNDDWMLDQGFLKRPVYGDLRDLIYKRHVDHSTVFAKPDETLMAVLTRMKEHGISQLPVMENDQIVGIIDESDFLLEVMDDKNHFQEPVSKAMTAHPQVIGYQADVSELVKIFQKGFVPIVVQDKTFLGIITRIDLINYLKQTL